MPRTRLVLYCDADGTVPIFEWLDTLVPKARAKCRVRLERLAELGHELRRPEADYLRDGIHELRVKQSGANHRMLYFFPCTKRRGRFTRILQANGPSATARDRAGAQQEACSRVRS